MCANHLKPATTTRLPAAIWALGFVSLLMDVSSEMVHSLLPLFLVTAVGASALVVGVIEGLAEALALLVMNVVYSLSAYPVGRLADRMSPVTLLTMGLAVLLVADLVLAFGGHWSVMLLGSLSGACTWA